jgi:methylisocitrate lyase
MTTAVELVRKTTRLRRLIEAPELLVMPGVYDPISVKLVERAGFAAAQCSGMGISASLLGLPDVSIVSMREMVDRTARIVEATQLPVMADADTGFGNAVNAYFAAQAFERAGAAGLNIEDQVLPKRCGHLAGKELISTEEMVLKIRAVRAALNDPDFVINARTDALAVEGTEAAVNRANAYLAAGATMAYVDAVGSLEEIRTLARGIKGPLGVSMVEGGRTAKGLRFSDLQEAGVARVSLSLSTLFAAVAGIERVLAAIKANGHLSGHDDLVAGFDDVHNMLGMGEVRDLERQFLPSAALQAKYGDKGVDR